MIGASFFISPRGEIIPTTIKHIDTVLRNPEKFGFNREILEFIYRRFGEKIGQEGKARQEILIALINMGWIRIREYRQFWTVNVKQLTPKVKQYLQKFAQALIQKKLGHRDPDPFAIVKIDSPNNKVLTSNMKAIANSADFIAECKEDIEMPIISASELPDMPLSPYAEKVLNEMTLAGPRMQTGVTTKDKTGHIHQFSVDKYTGNGATDKTHGHNHKIRKFIVKPSKDGHTHNLGKAE